MSVRDSERKIEVQEYAPDLKDAIEREVARMTEGQAVLSDSETDTDDVAGVVPEFRPFPTGSLPDSLSEFVQQTSAGLDCDSSMVAVPLLSVLGAATGSAVRLKVKNNWAVPANIWTCTIAKSGSAKSPAIKAATGLLRTMQDEFDREHGLRMEEHKPEAARYRIALKQWEKNGGIGNPPLEPVAPAGKRLITTDATLPGLANLMSRDPGGKLYLADELAAWLVNMTKFNSQGDDSNAWNELFDGNTFWHDRKVSDSLKVRYPAISITGGIQPSRIFKCFTPDNLDSGLAARVLFFQPPERPRSLRGRGVDASLVQNIENRLLAMNEWHPASEDPTAWHPYEIEMEPAAFAAYEKWYDARNLQIYNFDQGALNAAMTKIVGYCPRFALVLHCFQNPNYRLSQKRLSADQIKAAIEISDWFIDEAARLYLGQEMDPDAAIKMQVKAVLRERGAMSLREIRHAKRNLRGVENLESILISMVRAGGLTQSLDMETGGRPATRWGLTL